MDTADREALIHMLLAQRAQIDASLALLTKGEQPAAPEPPTRRERPVFGRQPRGEQT